jgi:hypothetical protein
VRGLNCASGRCRVTGRLRLSPRSDSGRRETSASSFLPFPCSGIALCPNIEFTLLFCGHIQFRKARKSLDQVSGLGVWTTLHLFSAAHSLGCGLSGILLLEWFHWTNKSRRAMISVISDERVMIVVMVKLQSVVACRLVGAPNPHWMLMIPA